MRGLSTRNQSNIVLGACKREHNGLWCSSRWYYRRPPWIRCNQKKWSASSRGKRGERWTHIDPKHPSVSSSWCFWSACSFPRWYGWLWSVGKNQPSSNSPKNDFPNNTKTFHHLSFPANELIPTQQTKTNAKQNPSTTQQQTFAFSTNNYINSSPVLISEKISPITMDTDSYERSPDTNSAGPKKGTSKQ